MSSTLSANCGKETNARRNSYSCLFGEVHANKQEYEFLRALVSFPQFADKVDDIVVEYETLYIKRLWIATSPVKTCPSKKSRRLGGIRWRWALYHRSILPCTKPSG